jgi:ubiquinone/menaquinone biosynthesis C-methylase UbiE
MSESSTYWDNRSKSYSRWWAPVAHPAALQLLDRLAQISAIAEGGRVDLLDLGTGTGLLAMESVLRWPKLRAIGLDPSPAMLEIARRTAAGRPVGERRRLQWIEGSADFLPFPDGSFDVTVSSFVFQFLPDRHAALKEVRRTLRPGGVLAFVTWKGGHSEEFLPDETFLEVLRDFGHDWADEGPSPASRLPASPSAAAQQARRAGFRNVVGRQVWLEYQFDPQGYLELLQDEAPATFAQLEPDDRKRLEARVAKRWSTLPQEAFLFRHPLVSVTACAS